MFSNSNLESTTLTLKSQQHDLVGVVVNHSHISRAASCSEPQPGPLAFERPVLACFLRGPAPVWLPSRGPSARPPCRASGFPAAGRPWLVGGVCCAKTPLGSNERRWAKKGPSECAGQFS